MSLISSLKKLLQREGQKAKAEKSSVLSKSEEPDDYEARYLASIKKDCYDLQVIERAIDSISVYFSHFLDIETNRAKLIPSLIMSVLKDVGIVRDYQLSELIGTSLNSLWREVEFEEDGKALTRAYIEKVNLAKQRLLDYLESLKPEQSISA